MIIGIHGSGALAIHYGLILQKNHHVFWFTESTERVGIYEFHNAEGTKKQIQFYHMLQAGNDFDIILVFRKSHQLSSSTYLDYLSTIPKDLHLIVIANGMGYQSDILNHHPNTTYGVTNIGVTLSGSQLKSFGKESLYFPRTTRCGKLNTLLPNNMAFFIDDFEMIQFTKLITNCCINPLTALLKCCNGELSDPQYHDLFHGIIEECQSVIHTKITSPMALFNHILKVCELTSNNQSSMLQDLQHSRETEIDHLNGYIMELGKELGISTPLNKKLTQLIKTKTQAKNFFDLSQKLSL